MDAQKIMRLSEKQARRYLEKIRWPKGDLKAGKERFGKVVAAVERGGRVRVKAMRRLGAKDLKDALDEMVDDRSVLITDGWKPYRNIAGRFIGGHEEVHHRQQQYVKDGWLHTNSVEGFFSLMKRGVNGTFHHVSARHLQRYADEFAFRYCHKDGSDVERTEAALAASDGPKLELSH